MASAIRGLSRLALLHVRLSDKERKAFDEAAEIAGLSRSSWSRMMLRRAAIAELNAAGRKVDL